MFRTFKLFTILFIVVLALSACNIGKKDPVTLTEKDAGKTVELKTGDTFVVSLDGNPTTGYNWEMAPQSTSLVQQVGDAAFTSADSSKLGSGGKVSLTFKAVAAGKMHIKLLYHRSWEKDVDPLKTFEFDINVQ